MLDFPSNSPSFSLYTSAAFDHTVGRKVVVGSFAMVHLVHGAADLPRFTYAVNHLTLSHNNYLYVESEDAQIDAVEGSIRPQATGWWLFALLAGLAGTALIGQALSRQSIVEREMYPTLSALGFRPNQLFGLGIVRGGGDWGSRHGRRAGIRRRRGLTANAGGRGPRRRADRGLPL